MDGSVEEIEYHMIYGFPCYSYCRQARDAIALDQKEQRWSKHCLIMRMRWAVFKGGREDEVMLLHELAAEGFRSILSERQKRPGKHCLCVLRDPEVKCMLNPVYRNELKDK